MAEEDAVLSKFESIVNHFGEAAAQIALVVRGKSEGIEEKVKDAGGKWPAIMQAVGNALPTAEKKVMEGPTANIFGPFAPQGTPDAARDKGIGMERLGMLGQGISSISGGMFGMGQDAEGKSALKDPAQAGKDIMSGIGQMFGALGGPVGQAGMVFAKIVEKGIAVIDFMQQWSEALHEGNMKFAEFSGAMSAVQAEQEVRDIQLSQQRGERRAEAAGYLAEGKSQLATATAPWGDMLSNVQSYIGGVIDRALAGVLTPLNYLASWVGLIDEEGNDDKESPLDKYYKAEYQKRYGKPPRF